jgi:mannose-6-phosphate isomerase-like protein (cupin superfamily)
MTNLHEIAAARPFALEPGAGERIWFTNAEMTIKATAAGTDGHLCMTETRAPVGHGPPMHVHHDQHEAFYVLEGELAVACADERYRAPAGSFAFLPRGVAHTFRVVGGAPARLSLSVCPAAWRASSGTPAARPTVPGCRRPRRSTSRCSSASASATTPRSSGRRCPTEAP